MVRSTAPSTAQTAVALVLTVFGSLGLGLMVLLAMGVVDSARSSPNADSGGPIVAFGAIIMLGWTPVPGVLMMMFWKSRAAQSLVLASRSLRSIGETVGVRPLIGWIGRAVLRVLMIVTVLLIPYQFFADRLALPAAATSIAQLLVLLAWTGTRVELVARINQRLHRPPAPR